MKAEINNHNKAKFFALYWDQEVAHVKIDDAPDKGPFIMDLSDWKVREEDSYLLLKSLSQISDEDAIEVAKIYYGKEHVETYLDDHWKYIRAIKEEINNKIAGLSGLYIIDFLRSKGYALPWMGLSVMKMVEAGWIKLTEI